MSATVSLMPADNIEGFRPEVIAALKQLRFGVLRFPGGNFCVLVRVALWRWHIDKAPAYLRSCLARRAT